MTIQDISCIGKCSLTVALPIISSMGVETAIVPTAVLSTHTMFKNFTFRDLTDDLESIKDHWKKEGFEFDAIYTGYLGSDRQIDIVSDYIQTFKKDNTIVVVDPAMADSGKLYAGFDEFFPLKMRTLCKKADIILPNISEAALMLEEEYPGEEANEATIKKLLIDLSEYTGRYAIITGTEFEDGTFGYSGYDKKEDKFFSFGTKKIPYRSHGTGDIFASTFTGAITLGFDISSALNIASKYTTSCIESSANDPERVTYGVNFETKLPYLIELIQK